MNDKLSSRDIQTLSDYLDGRLNRKEQASLEIRLQSQVGLRDELEALKQTRVMLQTLPRRRAPRNFTLSPAMAPGRPAPRLFPVFSMASVLAGLVLVAVFLGSYFTGGPASGARPPALSSSSALTQGNYAAAPANPASPMILWGTPTYPARASGLGGGGSGGGGQPPAAASPIEGGTVPPSTDQTESQPAMAANPAPTETPGVNDTSGLPGESSTPANPPAAPLAPLTQAPAATAQIQAVTPHTGAPAANGAASQSKAAESSNGPILGVQPTESQGQIEATSAPAPAVQYSPVPVWGLAEAGAGLLTIVLALLAFYFYRKEKY